MSDLNDFEWPCSEREAHGPHPEIRIEAEHGCDGSEDDCMKTCPVPVQVVFDCPGVSAHPLTMIGGQYR